MGDETYISQLKAERDNIDQSFTHAIRLLGEGKLTMSFFFSEEKKLFQLKDLIETQTRF